MKDIIIWCINHKQLILLYLDLLLNIILLVALIVRRKKVKSSESNNVLLDVLSHVPEFIGLAETVIGSGNGSLKLDYVLTLIKTLNKELGYSGDYDFKNYIEAVLSTPQKGDTNNG